MPKNRNDIPFIYFLVSVCFLFLIPFPSRHIKASSFFVDSENQTGSLVLVFVVSNSVSEEVEILFVAEDYASELCLLKSHCCRDPCTGAQIRAGHPL